MNREQGSMPVVAAGAFALVTISLIWVASCLPQVRALWGLGVWSHIPWPVSVGASAGVIALILSAARWPVKLPEEPLRLYWPLAAGVVMVLSSLYVLLPAKTHFLGDGYQVLAQSSRGELQVKLTAWGEGMVHVWLGRLTGVSDTAGALAVYRATAAVSGCVFLLAATFAAGRLYKRSGRSLVFLLGLATGSWTLLYFGYVEHYALFVTAAGLYVLAGLLALRGEISRWWLVGLTVAAAALHVFGAVLLVPTLYVLLADTAPVRRLAGLSLRGKIVLLALGIAVAIGAGAAVRSRSYFLFYSLLPVLGDNLSYDRYAVLSLRHAVDLLNLCLLLVPALPAATCFLLFRGARKGPTERPVVFLVLAFFSAFCTAVVFDPKLGMPRDWDLFSFAAIPATALLYLIILRQSDTVKGVLAVGAVGIALFALSGRVIALNSPAVSVERFKDYISWDHQRHLRSWYHLGEYYRAKGDSVKVAETKQMWDSLYPERVAFWEGFAIRASSRTQAAKLFSRAIEINPTYADAWAHLGEHYAAVGMYDSAQATLNTALKLNPNEPSAHSNQGVVYLARKRPDLALKYLEKAHALNPKEPMVSYNLAMAHLALKQENEFLHYMEEAAALPAATADIHVDLGDWYASRGNLPLAGAQYSLALSKGEKRDVIADRIKRFPELAQYIRSGASGKTD